MAAKPVPRKRKDGSVYWIQPFRLVPGGKPTSETFETKAEAEKFGRLVDKVGGKAARENRTSSTYSKKDVPTLETWALEYIQARAGISSGTRRDYTSTVRRSFAAHAIGALPLDAIDRAAVERFVRWYEGEGKSAKTVEQARSLLAQIMQAAVEGEIITRNPVRGVRAAKGTAQQMTFLTPAEFTALATHCPPEALPLITFLYGTGMRWGEATALTWADLDLEATVPTANVWRTWKRDERGRAVLGTTKTRRSQRKVSLPREVVDLLPAPGAGGDFVFTSFGQRAGAIVHRASFYKMVWKPLVAAANDPAACAKLGVRPLGKRPRMHDLRHSHASWLISQNLPMTLIQRRLGHESIKTTSDTYGSLMPDALALGAAASSLAFAGTFPELEA